PTRLSVRGDGTQEKPYLHVDDLLSAIERALLEPADPIACFNIAGEGSTTVRAIAEMVRDELGLRSATIEYGEDDRGWPGDVPRFRYDTRRIRALGWRPARDSREAVRAAIRACVDECRRSS
ncbi:MAG TPA: hypothetical protein VHB97_11940, partial [Polyangia bacterium]|nr:hypothetical protein [Polyangia bacterium]